VALLKHGEWSDWIPARFGGAHGMIRIYAQAIGEITKIYISPVNIDPVSPDLPLSTPASYSKQLAQRVGRYYTQGIAEDTAALRQGVLSRQEYLTQSALVAGEHLKLLHQALSEFHEGLLFFHYFRIDQNSHMLWGKYEDELLASYQDVDRELAVVERMIGDASLVVLSDHGFTSFDRAVHINSWLREQGWLHYKEGMDDFQSVDWSRTKVYSLGLNAIYLNLRGREAHGIVPPEEGAPLAQEIMSRLRELRDNGKPVIDSLVRSSGPDFLIGYAKGYRSSWETALGSAPPGVIEDNVDAWIGDHCVDARHVPGVLLLNRKPRRQGLKLEDVTVTILSEFGISPPSEITGVAF
jgi:predicted AlkP superfamily phosphohydrolase/phosphomutase